MWQIVKIKNRKENCWVLRFLNVLMTFSHVFPQRVKELNDAMVIDCVIVIHALEGTSFDLAP